MRRTDRCSCAASFWLSLTVLGCGIDGQIDLLDKGAAGTSPTGDAADGAVFAPDGSPADVLPSDTSTFESADDTRTCPQACVSPTPYCDSTSGACVACLDDGDCAAAFDRHLCDPSAHRCVECLLDSDCGREFSAACDLVLGDCIH